MRALKIALVGLGTLKHPVDFNQLTTWKSGILKIEHRGRIGQLPNAEGLQWEYTDKQLDRAMKPYGDVDLTIGIVDAALEGNYYMRRLSERSAVISLYEMADIVVARKFSVEQYLLRNVYELVALFVSEGNLIPSSYGELVHDEVRHCIFDMNSTKEDIVFSMNRPRVCESCWARMSSNQLPHDFLSVLQRELRRIKKPMYARLEAVVKQHPLWSLIVTSIFAIALNIASDCIQRALGLGSS